MKITELLEEIKKDNIQKSQLNEQAAFSRFLSKTLPALGQTFEHNFFTELRNILRKDLTTVSPKEMAAAFKAPQMAAFRRQIADKLMETEFDTVDNILRKYNLSVPQESINAGKELATTLEIDPAFLKDVRASWAAKKGAGTTATTAGQTTATTAGQTTAAVAGQVAGISEKEISNLINGKIRLYFKDIEPKKWYSFMTRYGKEMKNEMTVATKNMANAHTYDDVAKVLDDIITKMSSLKQSTAATKLSSAKIESEVAKAAYYRDGARRGGTRRVESGNLLKYVIYAAFAYGLYYVWTKVGDFFNDTTPENSGFLDKYLPDGLDNLGDEQGNDITGQNQGQNNKPSRGAIDKFR